MPSQFEQVMDTLDEILNLLQRLTGTGPYEGASSEVEEELFGEDPISEGRKHFYEHGEPLPDESGMEEELEVLRPKMPGVTRRLVEVKGVDGNTKTVSRDDLDPRILQVLDASIKAGTFWFLYERESDGQIMISAEERVINQVGRGAVPPGANEPDETE